MFSFDTNEGLSTHRAPGDAMAYVLEGSVKITIGEDCTTAKAGDAVVMPANVPHALKALTPYKMLLVMVKA
jgi:quercetin dioxygenase-like cupin family protein